ncbi:glycoside hydrolase family 19 protein [Meiothermus granaticius]|uniref:Chitinase class I n=1 Tax=Meiothermus granaticius NBRC 107808 TaxID=1227551 RepID=A0A399FFD7_9DEIN|nr:glycoside hydrolase family 19 protein [Meiothermus granaticius]RIH93982.1 Chitinase class I [Meiothermus granaticius NBRC 107808]GEM88189.1 lysozyme [Meiothermus granaticius NBRC 107808]
MPDPNRFEPQDLEALVGAQKAALWYSPLLEAFRKYEITNSKRQAAFLAQALHETGGLRWLEEIWGPTPAQQRYEGRLDLGNTQPGDGYRYRGRGIFQLTGRNNYRNAGAALGIPLEERPELAVRPEYAALIAGWYWKSRNLSPLADAGDFLSITRRINGGLNGLADRLQWWAKAKTALQVPG